MGVRFYWNVILWLDIQIVTQALIGAILKMIASVQYYQSNYTHPTYTKWTIYKHCYYTTYICKNTRYLIIKVCMICKIFVKYLNISVKVAQWPLALFIVNQKSPEDSSSASSTCLDTCQSDCAKTSSQAPGINTNRI